MPISLSPRLALVVVWVAMGCGGRVRETTAGEPTSAGSAGGVSSSCDELQRAADEALETWVDANNTCDSDADCTSVVGVGVCYTYCVVPVRRTNLHALSAAGQESCRAYVERGCAIQFACPNTPGVACIDGRCAFNF